MVPDCDTADEHEKARAARILVPVRRRGFLFRRAVQRHVIGRYATLPRIVPDESGKPRLQGAPVPLEFSASSAREFCAVAVSAEAVGVDIVATAAPIDLAAICARFVPGFAVPGDCPEAVRRRAGQWQWARFEAGLKLRGTILFDALSGRTATPYGHADLLVAGAGFVCAVARPERFRLARLELLPFARIAAHAG